LSAGQKNSISSTSLKENGMMEQFNQFRLDTELNKKNNQFISSWLTEDSILKG